LAALDSVIIAGIGNDAKVWDLKTGKPVKGSISHEGRIYAISVCPGRKIVLTASEDEKAELWDMSALLR
jgi:WD40 repeat protein